MTKAAFRVDASVSMGSGHLMRSLTLAELLRSRGVHVRFICREHAGHLASLLQDRAFPTVVLPESTTGHGQSGKSYEAWLGASTDADAAQTVAALSAEKPDWLIVDHYGAGIRWEQQVRHHVGKLMAIDDLANRSHDCDLLLDQNYSASGDERYSDLVPDDCTLLTGPQYALLAPEYAAYRRTLRPRDAPPRRVLVSFGGSDPQNATGLALEALARAGLRHLEVDAVVGVNNPHRPALQRQAEARPGTTIHGQQRHLAALMSQADLAIGAGGFTTWERMCLGLPAVIVSIAENQEPACTALADAGLVHYAGNCSAVDADQLAAMILRATSDARELAELGARNRIQVDGLGAGRVAEVLFPASVDEIRLRPAVETDAVAPHETGDPAVGAQLVLEAADIPLGWMRIERGNDEFGIDWTLDPIVRGRSWDAHLVALGMRMIREASPGKPAFFYKTTRTPAEDARHSIAVLSDSSSWMNEHIPELLLHWLIAGHRVSWIHDQAQLQPGDFCFLLGCGQIVPPDTLTQYRNSLLVHESDLPHGKGWSPLTWQILEGKNRIPVTLLEAAEKVDSGAIYSQESLEFDGDELIDEMRDAVGRVALGLCMRFVENYPRSLEQARKQDGRESFYSRRGPADSRLDGSRTLESQFDLLRVVDNERYPGFFEHRGHRYLLGIKKEGKS